MLGINELKREKEEGISQVLFKIKLEQKFERKVKFSRGKTAVMSLKENNTYKKKEETEKV